MAINTETPPELGRRTRGANAVKAKGPEKVQVEENVEAGIPWECGGNNPEFGTRSPQRKKWRVVL